MTIDDQIEAEKLQYDVIEKLQRYLLCHLVKIISMNIFVVKKYYHLINNK